jgi:sigma-B regulation protein RsbU (phosphoserine phosphatase)
MDAVRDTLLRTQLLERRERLESAIAEFEETTHLVHLLQEVDAALQRMDTGSYGLCEVCHDPIEEDRLTADPLLRNCLDHLTPGQRRALEQDLDLASQIQNGLLPKQSLSFAGWEVYYHYEAAGPVSGDYCDWVSAGRSNLFFLLGDVSGKGVAASMLMAHLHAIFRSLITLDLPVSQLVEQANRVFCESTAPEYFATLVCGKASGAGAVEVCNAGHCPPLWVRGGEVTSIEATGLPVGLFCSGQYSVKKMQLAAGDSLLLYTDGLSEARNGSDAEYGVERLSKLAGGCHGLSPRALIGICLEDLAAFQSGTPKTDDLTLVAVRRVE